jgi:hypothetical protein
LGGRGRACNVGPDPVDQALKDHGVGFVALVLEHCGDDVVVLVYRERGGNTEFTHSSDLA